MNDVPQMNGAEYEALYSTLSGLEKRWLPKNFPHYTNCFGYDPLPFVLFIKGLHNALPYVKKPLSFLDIGCGLGTKLKFMKELGWNVSGIDIFKPYIESARELVPEAKLTVADAFSLDVFSASLIYCYRPMIAEKDQFRLEKHIIDCATSGSILFFPTRSLEHYSPNLLGESYELMVK